jgi:hypothetical protein
MHSARFRRRFDTRFRDDRRAGFLVAVIVVLRAIIIVIVGTCHIFGTPGRRIGTD